MPEAEQAGFEQAAVMVTGASSGIGQATAIALAKAGCSTVGIHYRQNKTGIEETAKQIESHGSQPIIFAADLADPQSRANLVTQVFDSMKRIDSWIHLAGGDVLTGEARNWTFDEKLNYLWQVDVAATISIGREVSEKMKRAIDLPDDLSGHNHPETAPSIVLIGWDQAPRGMEGDAGQMFGPIKAAVMAFANGLAQQVAPKIRVNTVAPGWIQTAWGEKADAYWNRRAIGQSLAGRWGTPEDVAQAILYAANPDHSFVTGQTIEVNGGWNRRFPDTSKT